MPEPNAAAITYVVSEFRDNLRWHNVLTTRDEAAARALLKVLGEKQEQFGPREAETTALTPPGGAKEPGNSGDARRNGRRPEVPAGRPGRKPCLRAIAIDSRKAREHDVRLDFRLRFPLSDKPSQPFGLSDEQANDPFISPIA